MAARRRKPNVIEGQQADVVTLALPTDTEAIEQKGLIQAGWADEFPNGSLPYSRRSCSSSARAIRKHQGLARLGSEGVDVITPNPKTSGNGKLSFLAAWGSVIETGGSEAEAKEFVTELYKHVPVLDSGGRAATTTFAQRGIGDVHLTWENEAFFNWKKPKASWKSWPLR